MVSPDELNYGQLINLGNSYHVQNGDTWSSISVRFGISVDLLQTLNPDLKDLTTLAYVPSSTLYTTLQTMNTTLCVMPETCASFRPTVAGIRW
mmetsp:Transcript_47229/g.125501  ORF Transcript_47229/g.125501 Transcript_47229/m.125501 type:complete len:93 (+) Transcript_47229:519-797(+)